MKYSATVLAALVILTHSPAAFSKEAPPKKKVAVLQFTGNNVTGDIPRIIRNNVEMNFFNARNFDVLEQNQIDVILKERKRTLTTCGDEKCGTEIGELLAADYVVIGSVDKLDRYTMTVKIVDVKTKSVMIADLQDATELGDIRAGADSLSLRVIDRIVNAGKKPRPKFSYVLSVNFQYSFPLDYFKTRAASGYGGDAMFRIENFFVQNYFIGVTIGYNSFEGKGNVHHVSLLPITATTGYRVSFWRCGFIPYIGFGGVYSGLFKYRDDTRKSYTENGMFEPVLQAGTLFDIFIIKNYLIQIGAEFGTIFEKDAYIYYIALTAGLSFRF